MKKMTSEFNELILTAEKVKKKGGSMAAVFKLIQELLDFEEKIQECINAQEMTENKNRIENFMGDIDKMYDSLFEMARGGISQIRNQRVNGMMEPSDEEDGGSEVEEDIEIEPEMGRHDILEKTDKRRTPVMLNVPQIPKM